jgi:hypothetical protein
VKNFVYIIGTCDDFESIEDLKHEYFNDPSGSKPDRRNMSVYPVSLDESCKVGGYDTLEEIATMIARGEAMTNDWCLDGTFGDLLEA